MTVFGPIQRHSTIPCVLFITTCLFWIQLLLFLVLIWFGCFVWGFFLAQILDEIQIRSSNRSSYRTIPPPTSSTWEFRPKHPMSYGNSAACRFVGWYSFIYVQFIDFYSRAGTRKFFTCDYLQSERGRDGRGTWGGGGILTIRNHYSMMPFPLLELINQRSMIRRLQAIDSVSEMPRLLGLRLELRLRCRFPSIPNLKMSCHNYVGRKTSRVGDLRLNSIS